MIVLDISVDKINDWSKSSNKKDRASTQECISRWLTQDDEQLLVFSCGLGFLTVWWLRYRGDHRSEKNRQKGHHFL